MQTDPTLSRLTGPTARPTTRVIDIDMKETEMSHTASASATRLHALHDSTLPGARHSSMSASNIQVAWTLERDGDSARCVLGSVGDRVELHISMSHDVILSQRCGSPEQAAAVSDAWWMALVSRGWLAVGTSVAIKPKLDRRS